MTEEKQCLTHELTEAESRRVTNLLKYGGGMTLCELATCGLPERHIPNTWDESRPPAPMCLLEEVLMEALARGVVRRRWNRDEEQWTYVAVNPDSDELLF